MGFQKESIAPSSHLEWVAELAGAGEDVQRKVNEARFEFLRSLGVF